jgi:hypothetical protein
MKDFKKYLQYARYLIPTVAYDILTGNPRRRFLTASWSVGFIVAGYLILSSQNILTVITPGLYYKFPVMDKREPIELTGFHRVHGTEISTNKLVLRSGDSVEFARRIAFLINEPALIHDKNLDSEFKDVDNQADLGYCIKKIWLHSTKGKPGFGALMIDLRESTMIQEALRFTESRGDDKIKSAVYLDRYFTALAETILKNDSKVSTVQFMIDGQSKEIAGMHFSLKNPHSLADFK